MESRKHGPWPVLLAGVGLLIMSLFLLSIVQVLSAWLPTARTGTMPFLRAWEKAEVGKSSTIQSVWIDIDDVPKHVLECIVSAEDIYFMKHQGFNWNSIKQAEEYNKTHEIKIGGSTITMQTCKNLFLWPDKSYVRKALEAYYTILMEKLVGKKRILELYINIIEWGDGIYGLKAASLHYFNKTPEQLTRWEAALMAACLPNPRYWWPSHPDEGINAKAAIIAERSSYVMIPKLK
jgi:monofunctional biosynthetic peptidoglycan transglycosylase